MKVELVHGYRRERQVPDIGSVVDDDVESMPLVRDPLYDALWRFRIGQVLGQGKADAAVRGYRT